MSLLCFWNTAYSGSWWWEQRGSSEQMFNRLMSTKALGEVTDKKQLYVIVLA